MYTDIYFRNESLRKVETFWKCCLYLLIVKKSIFLKFYSYLKINVYLYERTISICTEERFRGITKPLAPHFHFTPCRFDSFSSAAIRLNSPLFRDATFAVLTAFQLFPKWAASRRVIFSPSLCEAEGSTKSFSTVQSWTEWLPPCTDRGMVREERRREEKENVVFLSSCHPLFWWDSLFSSTSAFHPDFTIAMCELSSSIYVSSPFFLIIFRKGRSILLEMYMRIFTCHYWYYYIYCPWFHLSFR